MFFFVFKHVAIVFWKGLWSLLLTLRRPSLPRDEFSESVSHGGSQCPPLVAQTLLCEDMHLFASTFMSDHFFLFRPQRSQRSPQAALYRLYAHTATKLYFPCSPLLQRVLRGDRSDPHRVEFIFPFPFQSAIATTAFMHSVNDINSGVSMTMYG